MVVAIFNYSLNILCLVVMNVTNQKRLYNTFMADNIGSIASKRDFNEPPQFKVIKNFVQSLFQYIPKVSVSQQNIVIFVPSAAMAGALQPHLHKLQSLCETKKRLIIRIGS